MLLPITAYTCTTAAGRGVEEMVRALVEHRGGLRRHVDPAGALDVYVGRVDGIEDVVLPADLRRFDCRNNRLAELALNLDGFAAHVSAVLKRHGARRVGLVLGTSTSGVASGEEAFRHRDAEGRLPPSFDFRATQELAALSDYVCARLGVGGPAYTISTACASSTKTFIDAAQLIAAGVCDAVVVGGVDSLCDTSLRGFQALQLLAPEPCQPNSAQRKGISIGEAAAFALIERPAAHTAGAPCLLGYGESADAHHMSTPHPQGLGARLAMDAALRSAGLSPHHIDYVNMHGTGSHVNDRVEDAAIAASLGTRVPCSSTKGWTGHTLGAAGIVEAVIALLCLQRGLLPGHLRLDEPDPTFTCALQHRTERRAISRVLTNNFGFGGNNCCLVFGTEAAP